MSSKRPSMSPMERGASTSAVTSISKKEAKGAFTFAASGANMKLSRKMNSESDIMKQMEHELDSNHGSEKEVSFVEEEPWIGAFIDLIYVATIMNISHLISGCGAYFNVWLLSAAYFLIMFMTRYNIDVYSICFLANDIVHRLIFLFYCLGVFVMTLNIAQGHIHAAHDDHASTDDMYTSHGGSDSGGGGHRFLASSSNAGPLGTKEQQEDTFFLGNCEFKTDYTRGFAAGFVFTRVAIVAMYCMSIRFSHNRDNIREYCIKMFPSLASLFVMFFAFGLWSPVILYPVTALVEFVCNVAPEFIFKIKFKPEAAALQARLGLYFMLVLGESMIGLLSVAYNTEKPGQLYSILVFSFLLVFSIGMQFFDTVHRSADLDEEAREAAEEHIHHHLNAKFDLKINEVLKLEGICDEQERKDRRHQLKHGEFRAEFEEEFRTEHEIMEEELAKSPFEHALLSNNTMLRVCFLWGHSTITYFMLIATTGFVSMYYTLNGVEGYTGEVENKYGDRFKISIGLFVTIMMMIIMRGMHRKAGYLEYLRKDYKRIIFKTVMAVLHLLVFIFPVDSAYCLIIHSCFAIFSNFIEVIWHFVRMLLFPDAADDLFEDDGEEKKKMPVQFISTQSGRIPGHSGSRSIDHADVNSTERDDQKSVQMVVAPAAVKSDSKFADNVV